jgi:hypothetical protein
MLLFVLEYFNTRMLPPSLPVTHSGPPLCDSSSLQGAPYLNQQSLDLSPPTCYRAC